MIKLAARNENFTFQYSGNFNYKGPLYIDFSGAKGIDGENGNELSVQVFRHGTHGKEGHTGWNGFPGKNITVRIFKDQLASDGKNTPEFLLMKQGQAVAIFTKRHSLKMAF